MFPFRAFALLLVATLGAGCVGPQIEYSQWTKSKVPASDQAAIVQRVIEKVPESLEMATLPHYSPGARLRLAFVAHDEITAKLGSQDYALIGEIAGAGRHGTTLDSLKVQISKHAASKGGDVVLIYAAGVSEQQYGYTTPGRSTTKTTGQAYGGYGFASGTATSTTTYSPPQTHYGTVQMPYARGLVLRHVPGRSRILERIYALSEDELDKLALQMAHLDPEKLEFTDINARASLLQEALDRSGGWRSDVAGVRAGTP